jgi:subtilase family serine protease
MILAAALAAGLTLPVGVESGRGVAANPTSLVAIQPGARATYASAAGPMTTAQCLQQFHLRCYWPAQLQKAYGLLPLFGEGVDGAGQTIIIVDSFGSPTIRHDLSIFDARFHLPAPPRFQILQPAGPVPAYRPTLNRQGWAGETTLDVEWAHSMAPGASIVLVETPTSENEGTSGFPQIETAEKYVIDHHLGGVISQSFSATEETFPSAAALKDLRGAYIDAAAKGVTVLTASGDSGAADVNAAGNYYHYPVTSWPDSDPLVTGVGGTELTLDAAGNRIRHDVVWNDTYNNAVNVDFSGTTTPQPDAGGGGLSIFFARPAYQSSVASVVGSRRGVPDISLSGACSGEVETYSSFGGSPPGWYIVCGTSESTPLFAGIVSLADQVAGHPLGVINPALYTMSAAQSRGLVDITSGNNTVTYTQHDITRTIQGFDAIPGYDLASGVGTVDAAYFVPELAAGA